jgi:hypothetical protein
MFPIAFTGIFIPASIFFTVALLIIAVSCPWIFIPAAAVDPDMGTKFYVTLALSIGVLAFVAKTDII